jgi:hypothetical protein
VHRVMFHEPQLQVSDRVCDQGRSYFARPAQWRLLTWPLTTLLFLTAKGHRPLDPVPFKESFLLQVKQQLEQS